MREVKVVATPLHDQVDQLLHVRVVALQVEVDELGDVEFEVLPHWRSQVGIDPALRQLLDCLWLTGV